MNAFISLNPIEIWSVLHGIFNRICVIQSFDWASIQGFQQEVVAGKIHELDAQYLAYLANTPFLTL